MAAPTSPITRAGGAPVNPGGDERPERRDEAGAGGTNGIPDGTSGGEDRDPTAAQRLSTPALYLILAGLIVLAGTVDTFSAADIAARSGRVFPLWQPIVWAVTAVLPILALVPAVRWGYRRVRALRRRIALALLVAAVVVVLYSVIHVAAMAALRGLVYAAVGEPYRAGWAVAEFFYEFRKDAMTCVFLFTVFFLNERTARSGVESVALDASTTPDLWLKDGAAGIRIDAAQVVWVASAGNYVEYVLANGRRHLIRGTLAGEEARLAPHGIVRVHRTRLVNVKRAVALAPRDSGDVEVRLDTGDVVVCSRRYRDSLRERVTGLSSAVTLS